MATGEELQEGWCDREPPPGDDEMVFIRQTNKQMNQTLNKINNAKAKNENMSSNRVKCRDETNCIM